MKDTRLFLQILMISFFYTGTTFGQCPSPIPLTFSMSSTTSTCEANGSITIIAQNGEPPYGYEIIAGPVLYPVQSSNLFSALPNGAYTVEVTDGCGVVLTDTTSVTGSYQIPVFSVGTTNPYCPAGLDGAINGVTTNGLPPFEYLLIERTTTPDTISLQSTGLFTGLPSGDYRIQVFDQCNNFQTRDISLQDPVLSPFTAIFYASTSTVQTDCNNLIMNASGRSLTPKLPYDYTLKNSAGTIVGAGQISRADTFLGVPTYGSYTFTVTDACGRIATLSNSITARATPKYGFNCDPYGVKINPAFMIGPYTYEIISGPEMRPAQTNSFFGTLTMGTYIIQVTDFCGTTANANVIINPISWETPLYSRPTDACAVGMSRFWPGTVTGSPQTPITYEIISAPPGVPLVSTMGHPANLGDQPPGSYVIKVTDACGVFHTYSPSITTTLSLNYTVSTQTGCQTGDILVSGAFTNPSGGRVRLERLDGSIARPYNTPISAFYNLTPDTFVLAFNSNEPGCNTSFFRDTVILPEASQPYLDLLTGFECVDQSATITGFPLDGVAPYTFEIISGPVVRPPQDSSIFNGLPYGTYDVRMVDACFNSFVNSVSIEPFLPELNGYTPPVCMGDSLDLYVDNIYGATYSWTGPNGFTADTFLITILELTPQDTGTYTVTINLPGCASTILEFELVSARCGAMADVRLLLEGPYDASSMLMSDQLRSSLLPTQEPYTALGYSHLGGGGEQIMPGVFDTGGSDAIVDWVFLELRDTSDLTTAISTRSALLQADGNVVDMDGTSPVVFDGIGDGLYYIVVRHRNHLDIMTPNPVSLSETTVVPYDFSTGQAYGGLNFPPQKDLGGGIYGLYACDFDNSGIIDATDRSIAWNFRNQTGYILQDANFDGICNAAERSMSWNNRNVMSHVP